MRIASLTAASLARPLLTMQRWWQQLHPALSAHVHPASWMEDGGSRALHTSSFDSVLTWRRSRSRSVSLPRHETASDPAEHGLVLPALWRKKLRAVPVRNCDVGLDGSVRHKFQGSAPALRVLHRPANLATPGGLVIAGRMSDVCAELDRLVAMEALH